LIGNGIKLVALLLLVAGMGFLVWEIRDFGKPDGTIEVWDGETGRSLEVDRTAMDDYYIDHSQDEETSANNVVTAIVFDYRGFDTLGEATVLFSAVTGVMLVLRKAFPSDKKKGGGSE